MSPTFGFHESYWGVTGSSTTPAAGPAPARQYPQWQIVPLLHGADALGVAWLTLVGAWRGLTWFLRLWWQTRFLDRGRRAALLRTLAMLRHVEYPLARKSVKKTALTLGFNRPEAWVDLNRLMKANPGETQNLYRHAEACRLLHVNAVSSTLTHPDAHLMIELAYQDYAAVRR